MSPEDAPTIVITGPSASGKGSVAFELARRCGLEIASLDSMKVYREMDAGTAKPSLEKRAQVAYHLLDLVTPDADFSVGEYLPRLDAALADAERRGRGVIICGGTILYLKAFLYGLAAAPPADWSVRQSLEDEVARLGLQALYERLEQCDPVAAARIYPQDSRRIVRALEVLTLTREPISHFWAWQTTAPRRNTVLFALQWDRDELYARSDRRVLRMVEAGLIEEAQALRARQPPLNRSATQCIGYKEVFEGFRSGMDLPEIIAGIQRQTRRLIKRQLTWLRKMPVIWIPIAGELDAAALAGVILTKLGRDPIA